MGNFFKMVIFLPLVCLKECNLGLKWPQTQRNTGEEKKNLFLTGCEKEENGLKQSKFLPLSNLGIQRRTQNPLS